jgi:hypothetical protein
MASFYGSEQEEKISRPTAGVKYIYIRCFPGSLFPAFVRSFPRLPQSNGTAEVAHVFENQSIAYLQDCALWRRDRSHFGTMAGAEGDLSELLRTRGRRRQFRGQ